MRFVPNILSTFRICLVPVFITVYFVDERDVKLYAVLIYALASFSDFLDGFIARRFEASSKLGKVLDPMGDKLMTVSVMVCITIDGVIPIWAVLVAGVKEILMAIGGFLVHKFAGVEMPPSNLIGKSSTVVFFLVCLTLMLFRDIPGNTATILISVAVALTFIALLSYINTYVAVMKNRESLQDETQAEPYKE
ncbi:MAG: CDP-alcohol phosphatidyltransferase family protein [Oscillospiraceae bacterium]|nr:CDP-alcohol phosphatidyltransferase family protein [Oscillospiraceae bacterium]